MARYSASVTKTSGAAAAWQFSIAQVSTARNLVLRELGLFSTTAAAGTYTLERQNAAGTGTRTGTVGQAEDPLVGATTAQIDTAWATTNPTRAATPIPFRTVAFPATSGSGIVWTFGPTGLICAQANALIVWQTTAAAVGLALYAVWDE